jgi:hypothetical protein
MRVTSCLFWESWELCRGWVKRVDRLKPKAIPFGSKNGKRHHVIYSTGEAQNCGIMTSELFISNDWIDGDQSQFEILAFRAVSMLWYVVGRLDHRLLKLPNVEVDNVSWMAEQWWRSARTGDSRRFEVHLELVASPCEGKKTFYAAKLVALGHVIWVRAE